MECGCRCKRRPIIYVCIDKANVANSENYRELAGQSERVSSFREAATFRWMWFAGSRLGSRDDGLQFEGKLRRYPATSYVVSVRDPGSGAGMTFSGGSPQKVN